MFKLNMVNLNIEKLIKKLKLKLTIIKAYFFSLYLLFQEYFWLAIKTAYQSLDHYK
jgi:hypothetical protein